MENEKRSTEKWENVNAEKIGEPVTDSISYIQKRADVN